MFKLNLFKIKHCRNNRIYLRILSDRTNRMKHQHIHKSPLFIWGILLLIIGLIGNIMMFVNNNYPHGLYFIFMVSGLFFVLIDFIIRHSRKISLTIKLSLQVLLIILPPLAAYLTFEVILPRANVIIVEKNFQGPFIIFFNIPGYPPIKRIGRDYVMRIPKNGILITSTMSPDVNLVEGYEFDVNLSQSYGKEINGQFGGYGSTSECGGVTFSYGYVTDIYPSELDFDFDKYISETSQIICNKRTIKNP